MCGRHRQGGSTRHGHGSRDPLTHPSPASSAPHLIPLFIRLPKAESAGDAGAMGSGGAIDSSIEQLEQKLLTAAKAAESMKPLRKKPAAKEEGEEEPEEVVQEVAKEAAEPSSTRGGRGGSRGGGARGGGARGGGARGGARGGDGREAAAQAAYEKAYAEKFKSDPEKDHAKKVEHAQRAGQRARAKVLAGGS